ncbi:MAG: hypothetical protein ACLFTK_11670 [Anaerolineales bacterium]
MHPEDRVLVGVIKRKKDFQMAQEQGWYRIPQGNASKGIHAEYIAFFFSRAFGEHNGAIHYYARRTGLELATRRDLLPDEPYHKHAEAIYHKLTFRELKAKVPPIRNEPQRRFSFIYTTWDRFIQAETINDLYSEADHFVDRVFYALHDAGYRPSRLWEAEGGYGAHAAQVRILCEDGEVVFSPEDTPLATENDLAQILERIKHDIQAKGGPRLLHTSLD